jgi:Flp pilus assembly protein TadD
VDLNPNLATAHHELGFSLTMSAQFAEAILCFEKAIRLSPNDPSRWNFYLLKADALFYSGECEDAIINVKEAIRLRPTAFWPYFTLASSLVELGRMEEAHAAVQQALARKPDITVTLVSDITKSFPSEYLEIYLENLRKAGLPE